MTKKIVTPTNFLRFVICINKKGMMKTRALNSSFTCLSEQSIEKKWANSRWCRLSLHLVHEPAPGGNSN